LLIPSREPVGELHQDHPDVVDHRQQHLAEVLGLALLARREGDRADLGHPFDDVRDLGAEQLADPVDRRQGFFHDVVEQPGRDGDRVQLHIGEEIGDRQGMDEVWLPRMAHLPPVLERGKDVGAPEQLDVGIRAVSPDLFEKILETNHEIRCLRCCWAEP
jgi:hypothetical protein